MASQAEVNESHIGYKKTTISMANNWENAEAMAKFYSEWGNYDQDYAQLYRGPVHCRAAVDKYYTGDRASARVLDVASGTGLVAQQLVTKGFTNIDGMEPAIGMIQEAKKKNLYQTIHMDFFTDNVECLNTSDYDILVMVGALGVEHFPVNGLPEMVRCVKSGGLVVIVGREEYVRTLEVYRGKLEPAMEDLETQGLWRKLERSTFPNYFLNHQGILYVYQVTK